MRNNRIFSATAFRRSFAVLVLLALAGFLAACKSYIFLPVDVAYEKLSPPYIVDFVNQTGSPFDVLPSSTGKLAGFAPVSVMPGQSFRAILQLRRITVGAGSTVVGAQVVDSPYFEQSPPDKAEVRFVQGDPRSKLIALQHPSWFTEYERTDAMPLVLAVTLRDFSPAPLFPRGPRAEP